jgi:uncharacterized membrane protein YfcA
MNEVWIICALVAFTAAVLQSVTGFGFGLISIPILSVFYDPHWVIPLVISLSFLTLCMNVKSVWGKTDHHTVKRLLLGSLLGLPIGAFFFYYFDVQALKLLVSSMVILVTLVLVFQQYIRVWLDEWKKREWMFGAASGFLTYSVGLPGPPVVVYLLATRAEPAFFRATSIWFLLLIYPVTLITFVISGALTKGMVLFMITLVPIILLGSIAGNKIHHVLPARMFMILTYILILSTGGYSLYQSL